MKSKNLMLLFILFSVCVSTNITASPEYPILIPAPVDHCVERIDEAGHQTEINMLVLHYTACSLARTLQIFLSEDRLVASHYTISEEGIVFQHASENIAAKHAGIPGTSYWQGKTALNPYAIGIEHVNEGYKVRDEQPAGIVVAGSDEQWYPFDERQIAKSIALCKQIIERHNIPPENIVGHSDVAPRRKQDPGPLFPWKIFAEHGIGAWPDENDARELSCFQSAVQKDKIHDWVVRHLHMWGYKLPDETASAEDIIRSFQMHFRQANISGQADIETARIVQSLLCKYKVTNDGRCPCRQLLVCSDLNN